MEGHPAYKLDLGGVVEWSIASVLKTEVLKGTVGSNPTPSAMPLNRPPARINTRFAVLIGTSKRPFLGQVYPKVYLFGLEESYPPEGRHKEETTPPLPFNGYLLDPVNYLHNREIPENAEQIPPLPPT